MFFLLFVIDQYFFTPQKSVTLPLVVALDGRIAIWRNFHIIFTPLILTKKLLFLCIIMTLGKLLDGGQCIKNHSLSNKDANNSLKLSHFVELASSSSSSQLKHHTLLHSVGELCWKLLVLAFAALAAAGSAECCYWIEQQQQEGSSAKKFRRNDLLRSSRNLLLSTVVQSKNCSVFILSLFWMAHNLKKELLKISNLLSHNT